MARYLEASRSREQGAADTAALAALDAAQSAWQTYRDKHCSAIALRWHGGSISGPMGINCVAELTRQRTRQLWTDYLTYPDSTPPVLPEPAIATNIGQVLERPETYDGKRITLHACLRNGVHAIDALRCPAGGARDSVIMLVPPRPEAPAYARYKVRAP